MGLLLDMRVVVAQRAEGRESNGLAGADEGQKRVGLAMETGTRCWPGVPRLPPGASNQPTCHLKRSHRPAWHEADVSGDASSSASGPEVFELHRAEPVDRLGEPLAERHLGLPVQLLLGQRDIGTPPLGVVRRERLLDQRRLRTRQFERQFGELPIVNSPGLPMFTGPTKSSGPFIIRIIPSTRSSR